MSAKNLLTYGLAATLLLSPIPSNLSYITGEYQKEASRQVRQNHYDSEIPTNVGTNSFTLSTESRLTKVETKIESVEKEIDSLSERFVYLSNDIKNLAFELRTFIKAEISIIGNKVNNLESKFDKKIERLENKVDNLGTTISKAKWFIAGAITVIGFVGSALLSLVSYIGFDKIAKILLKIVKLIGNP
jgi:chaperonin cofactor prefoldin